VGYHLFIGTGLGNHDFGIRVCFRIGFNLAVLVAAVGLGPDILGLAVFLVAVTYSYS
jgi:hypothetical protein